MHAKRVAKTVQLFQKSCPVPKLSSSDNTARAAQDLTEALLKPAPATPFATFGDETMTATHHLATIFAEASLSTSTYVSPPVSSTVYPSSAPRVLPPSPRVPPTTRVPTLPQTRSQVPHIIPPNNAMQPEHQHGVLPQPFVPLPIVEPDLHALPMRRNQRVTVNNQPTASPNTPFPLDRLPSAKQTPSLTPTPANPSITGKSPVAQARKSGFKVSPMILVALHKE